MEDEKRPGSNYSEGQMKNARAGVLLHCTVLYKPLVKILWDKHASFMVLFFRSCIYPIKYYM